MTFICSPILARTHYYYHHMHVECNIVATCSRTFFVQSYSQCMRTRHTCELIELTFSALGIISVINLRLFKAMNNTRRPIATKTYHKTCRQQNSSTPGAQWYNSNAFANQFADWGSHFIKMSYITNCTIVPHYSIKWVNRYIYYLD